jgi:pilus assembly protein FimV
MAANVPTVNMAAKIDAERTGKFQRIDAEADTSETEVLHTDSTAKMQAIDSDGVDLDFSQLTDESGHVPAAGGGSGDTAVREVFDNSQRVRAVDLDLSETVNRTAGIPNSMDTMEARKLVVKGADSDIPGGEFAPVTMSEVGTKLDLARAYMDMGDPEGARSILEEVVQEGSASQKKEATRLIQSLPG